jgi:hypothetical protein
MTRLLKALPLLLIACAALTALPLAAQTPDCSFTFNFTGAATQTAVSNLSQNTPCVNWRLTLSTTGTLSATVTFYTSPDAITWTAVPNTVCSSSVQPPCILQGANPIVGTQGMLYTASYGSYVQVVVTSPSGTGTGTVRGYGAKGASASGAATPGLAAGLFVPYTGATQDVNLGAHNLTVGNTVLDQKKGVSAPNVPTDLIPPSLNSWWPFAGSVIKATPASWDATYTGLGISVVWDHQTKQYAMMYGGYDGTEMRFGLAYSTDGIVWAKYGSNPVFAHNGTGGLYDSGGVTYPQITFNSADSLWYMYYIGFPTLGFEVGTPTINLATASLLVGPWTRSASNPILTASQFGAGIAVVYRPNVFRLGPKWYLFTNAGTVPGTENIYYATADALGGPWTPVTTPVLTAASLAPAIGAGPYGQAADPQVFHAGNLWYMLGWTSGPGTWLAYTTDESFPGGWTASGVLTSTAIRPTVAQIGASSALYLQSLSPSLTAIDLYAPISPPSFTRNKYVKNLRQYNEVGSGFSTFDFSVLGVRKAFIGYSSGGPMNFGIASGSAGAETESNRLALPVTASIRIYPTTTDPICTTLVTDEGKVWFDNTTSTTVLKVCMNVVGTMAWVIK